MTKSSFDKVRSIAPKLRDYIEDLRILPFFVRRGEIDLATVREAHGKLGGLYSNAPLKLSATYTDLDKLKITDSATKTVHLLQFIPGPYQDHDLYNNLSLEARNITIGRKDYIHRARTYPIILRCEHIEARYFERAKKHLNFGQNDMLGAMLIALGLIHYVELKMTSSNRVLPMPIMLPMAEGALLAHIRPTDPKIYEQKDTDVLYWRNGVLHGMNILKEPGIAPFYEVVISTFIGKHQLYPEQWHVHDIMTQWFKDSGQREALSLLSHAYSLGGSYGEHASLSSQNPNKVKADIDRLFRFFDDLFRDDRWKIVASQAMATIQRDNPHYPIMNARLIGFGPKT